MTVGEDGDVSCCSPLRLVCSLLCCESRPPGDMAWHGYDSEYVFLVGLLAAKCMP